jgi:hypothetical protein
MAVDRARSHVAFHLGSGHGLLKSTAHDCAAIGTGGSGGAGGAGIGSGGTYGAGLAVGHGAQFVGWRAGQPSGNLHQPSRGRVSH